MVIHHQCEQYFHLRTWFVIPKKNLILYACSTLEDYKQIPVVPQTGSLGAPSFHQSVRLFLLEGYDFNYTLSAA